MPPACTAKPKNRGEKKIEPQHLDKLFIIRHLVLLRHNRCYEQVHSCSAVRCCTRSTSKQPSNSISMRSKDASIPSRTETSPTVQKCSLRMHSQQTWPPFQTLSSAHKAQNVSVPATKDFMAHTTAATANLSSTRVRPPVTTAIAASSPDNHHAQAPRHPAPKSEALCEILDLLDGPLSFFRTFCSWLIITLVQLPKVAVRHRSFSINFEAHNVQAQCSTNNLSLLILAQTTHHSTRRAALVDNVVL